MRYDKVDEFGLEKPLQGSLTLADIRELAELIEQFSGGAETCKTPIPRVFLHHAAHVSQPLHVVYQPAVCFIAQGGKQAMAGESVYSYRKGDYLIVSVDVPIAGRITEASPQAPFLCLRVDLDPGVIGALMLESDIERASRDQPQPSLAVSPMTDELLDAAIRLVRLLHTPRDIPILAPLAEREILYRLLRGEQTSRMAQIAFAESKLQQVNRAITWVKANFRAPFSVERLAEEARMSTSALHQHFKTVTGMTPLQYQKQLRLQEARRLMLTEATDAAIAGHAVGYDSPSQFSREYRRLFGAPPLRDIEKLRATAGQFSTA
jgi:AraC-like DNA-binding protein